MSDQRILRIYLDDQLRGDAIDGHFKIMGRIKNAFEGQGFRVDYVKNSDAERAKSIMRRGYSLFYMDHPLHARALTLRKAYFFPFWRIEKSAKRWEWDIAKAPFKPSDIDPNKAKKFADYRRGLFLDGRAPMPSEGIVYIPLQGRLLEQRSFQTQSPLDMIRTTLIHEEMRDVVVGLHPGETYLPEELAALRSLVDKEPRLQLSSLPAVELLQHCDYVVTQNSSVALMGYFFNKPAVLFAQIDFHHIAANVSELGAQEAIQSAPSMTPDFERYVFWFLRDTAIHGGQDDVEDRILDEVRQRGWGV